MFSTHTAVISISSNTFTGKILSETTNGGTLEKSMKQVVQYDRVAVQEQGSVSSWGTSNPVSIFLIKTFLFQVY